MILPSELGEISRSMLEEEIELCRLRVRMERLRLAIAHQDPKLGSRPMREVRDLASTIRATLKTLREGAAKASSEFDSEVKRAAVNNQKVQSLTKELREANLEVEAILGESGSNFPTSEEAKSVPQGRSSADSNGVEVGNAADTNDQNGVRPNRG